jgi:NAD(P)-dependent dehydrogenase (short-subunit alcohol dehydrogenase family)
VVFLYTSPEEVAMQADRHEGRTVIVTGGSSGIGRGIALRFAEEGARVVNADVRRDPAVGKYHGPDDERPTDRYIDEALDGEATYVETDVSDPDAVEAMVAETVETYGGIDVLVNNAGLYIPGTTEELTIEEWRRMIEVDLEGVFFCSKAAIPHLKEADGHIVNIASVQADAGGGGPAYSSAKAAVTNLTRDLAVELSGAGVHVNAICPGYVKTPLQDYLTEAEIEAAREHTLTPFFGEPEDVGDAAVFLASEEARFVTGTALYVDGGWTAHR